MSPAAPIPAMKKRLFALAVIAVLFAQTSSAASCINRFVTRSERQRQIVTLRYVDGLTQQEIAQRIGMSQMYVSRLLGRILERMRVLVTEP